MEQMEARQMMAGDVAASVVDGNLYLNEAAGQAGLDNSVLISQIAPGRIRVTGNGTSDGTASLVNGAAFQDFNVTGSLQVNFGGGNDLVVFDGLLPPSFQDVNLNLAAPFSVPLRLPDRDNFIMWNANIRGSLTVNTGRDNDWVYVANADIGDDVGVDNVTINTGAGADTVHLKNLQGLINGTIDVQTYGSLSETDADVAWFEFVYASGNIGVRTGGGNDRIYLDNVTAWHDMNLDAGAGDDTAELNYALAIDNFMANLGDGSDSLTIKDLYVVNGKTRVIGGNGFDRLTKSGAYPTNLVEQLGWEYINGRPVGLLDGIVYNGTNTVYSQG
jgi:hypothetical protein